MQFAATGRQPYRLCVSGMKNRAAGAGMIGKSKRAWRNPTGGDNNWRLALTTAMALDIRWKHRRDAAAWAALKSASDEAGAVAVDDNGSLLYQAWTGENR